ncbi:nucleotide pyrophosphohydrolase [Arcobacter sp. CECT 8985]|uniref:nucleotide pyrophosphohydrolase n=1 Tax=Arcobacter sp. CECT 8985 TaxID=1935424 RepID=UPI00100B8F76|nr:nucleotide pyrophosphohydrolase [Arcobacter sp. CECT 8985]RXJ84899.1 nucleotide pyrophosphohydrolase [Arcobacter sp. CECT 8985]
MNIEKIYQDIKEFSKQRDWDKHHNPKNLAMALSVETAELVEIFQWLDLEESKSLNGSKKIHLKEEIADVAIYLLRICMSYDIDLEEAIFEKMKKNEIKYPLYDEQGNKIKYGKN